MVCSVEIDLHHTRQVCDAIAHPAGQDHPDVIAVFPLPKSKPAGPTQERARPQAFSAGSRIPIRITSCYNPVEFDYEDLDLTPVKRQPGYLMAGPRRLWTQKGVAQSKQRTLEPHSFSVPNLFSWNSKYPSQWAVSICAAMYCLFLAVGNLEPHLPPGHGGTKTSDFLLSVEVGGMASG